LADLMGDGTEPIPRLDAATIQRYQREIMQAATRYELNNLTRRVWRTYEGHPKNAEGLAQLRTAIEAKRDVLRRNDPR
jgi:hypothetical protein